MLIGILTGFFSGIVSGMGIGGGAILIPVLTIFMDASQKMAQGINLTYFIPTAIVAVFVHLKSGALDLKTAALLGASGLPGAALGALVAGRLSGDILRRMFGVFLLLVGIYEIYKGLRIKSR